MINENLKHGDLKGVVVERISVDEFEPKTGEKEDIAVIGFYVTEQAAGEDLARFIAKSVYESRDVEVTPNPNEDNLYMVFVEVDRKEGLVEGLRDLVKDITNVSKDLDWKVKPLLSDNELDLADPMLETIIRQSPESYQTKEAYQEQLEKIENGTANLYKFDYKVGKKFIKVFNLQFDTFRDRNEYRAGSVTAFIDKNTGEVYKPASWKAPAKHVRFDLRLIQDREFLFLSLIHI